jgi:hypothetical protein
MFDSTNENATGRTVAQSESTDKWIMPTAEKIGNGLMVSGYGRYHTDNPESARPEPYTTIDLEGIRALVDDPQAVPKDTNEQWVIPSSLLSRDGRRQENDGEYWMLWADFDLDPKPIQQIHDAIICEIVGIYDFELYNSRSAKEQKPKSRALIPLSKPLCGRDWRLAQEVLSEELMAAGFTPDPAALKFNQICYLPNRGELYETLSERDGELFDPMTAWAEKIEAKRQALREAAKKLEAEKKAASERRKAAIEARAATGGRSLIDAFNDHYSVHEILSQAGYDQRGDSFRHPGSESGSYSATVKDGRVHSLSSNDPLFTGGGGGGAHDAFSAFKVLMHGKDDNAALVDAGDNWLKIGGESWNAVEQREYMEAQAKKLAEDAANGEWPELADPFAEYVVPPFPVDALPEVFATWCRELSAQSGFDVGGYAFAVLVSASAMIDHRKKMRAGPLNVPAFLWGGLVAGSGGGKSPTLNAVSGKVRSLNDSLVRQSQREMAAWLEQCKNAATAEDRRNIPQKPIWRQLTASDTTVEALGALLADNPSGMLLLVDEMTGWIGRMDAYSGNGSGKDRAVYLSAFDGGSVTINRATKAPLVVDNFSVGMLTGIQPEKLGEQFKKNGGGSDGLYQRFLMYAMQPAGAVDYSATLSMFTEVNAANIFSTLHEWTENSGIGYASLCDEAIPLMEGFHQSMRTLAQRTSAKRFAEHLDEFPGFLARITFAVHCMECAAKGEYLAIVGGGTFQRALRIMQTMYHHSRTVYEVLDNQSGELSRLTQSACEAVLSKEWMEVKRGDLTRHATGWQGSDDRTAESAIDNLIELGWFKDVTPPLERGKRGRRSNGVFLVNKKAHQIYKNHAERIKSDRAARYQAAQSAGLSRNAAETAH